MTFGGGGGATQLLAQVADIKGVNGQLLDQLKGLNERVAALEAAAAASAKREENGEQDGNEQTGGSTEECKSEQGKDGTGKKA